MRFGAGSRFLGQTSHETWMSSPENGIAVTCEMPPEATEGSRGLTRWGLFSQIRMKARRFGAWVLLSGRENS